MHVSRMNNDPELIVVASAVSWFDPLIISIIMMMMMNFGIKLYFLELIAFFLSQKSPNERWKLEHTHSLKGGKFLKVKIDALNFNCLISAFKDISLASYRHQLFVVRQPSSMCMHVVTKINEMRKGMEWHVVLWLYTGNDITFLSLYSQIYCTLNSSKVFLLKLATYSFVRDSHITMVGVKIQCR